MLPTGKKLTFEIVGAFFLGGIIGNLATDPSAALYFYASSRGPLAPEQQVLFWYVIPALVYGAFFVFSAVLAYFTKVSLIVPLVFYLSSVIISSIFALSLPQGHSLAYVATVVLATLVSAGVVTGIALGTLNKRYLPT